MIFTRPGHFRPQLGTDTARHSPRKESAGGDRCPSWGRVVFLDLDQSWYKGTIDSGQYTYCGRPTGGGPSFWRTDNPLVPAPGTRQRKKLKVFGFLFLKKNELRSTQAPSVRKWPGPQALPGHILLTKPSGYEGRLVTQAVLSQKPVHEGRTCIGEKHCDFLKRFRKARPKDNERKLI